MLGYVQKYNCLPAKPTVSSTEKYEYKILSVLIQFIHLLNTAHVLSRIRSPGNRNLKEAQSLSFKAQKTRIKINSYSVHEREQCNPAGAGAALIEFLPLLEDPYKRVKERTLSQSAAEPLLSLSRLRLEEGQIAQTPLPVFTEVTDALVSLRNALEGFDKADGTLDSQVMSLHNLVHSFLNGTNASPHSAANDPVFVVRSETQIR